MQDMGSAAEPGGSGESLSGNAVGQVAQVSYTLDGDTEQQQQPPREAISDPMPPRLMTPPAVCSKT